MPEFLPVCLRERLLANGRISLERDHDPLPVVKFFTPDAGATWLLTELDPDHPDIAFGLCDLGLGAPELGCVSVTELQRSDELRGGPELFSTGRARWVPIP